MRRKYKWMNLRPAVRLLGRDDGGAFSISKGLICMAKFCPNCGKQLKDTDVFCTSCGKKFPQNAQPIKPIKPIKPRVTAEDELKAARDILCGIHLPDYSAALDHMNKAAKLGGHDGTLEAIVRMLGAIESLQAVALGGKQGLAKPYGNADTQKVPGQANPSQPQQGGAQPHGAQQGGPLPIVGNHGAQQNASQQGGPLPTVGGHSSQYGGTMPFAGQQSRHSGMSAGKAFAAGMAGAVAGSVLTHALSGNSSRAEASPSMHTTQHYMEPNSYGDMGTGDNEYTDLAGTDGFSDGYDGGTDGFSDGYDGSTDEFSDGYDGSTDEFSEG